MLQAQRDRICVKRNKNEKKSLANCSKTPSYIKVKAATALRAGSEAASESSTSADTEIESWMVSAMHVRIRLFQQPQYQPQTRENRQLSNGL